MTGNKTSRLSWAYQSAVGTEAIAAATDTTYFFGGKEKGQKWESPSITKDVEKYGSYSSREPALTPVDPSFEIWTVPFFPTTPQHMIWMLKQVTEDGISANVHKIEALDSGLPLPLTVRLELNEGSVDRLYQAVDCYCVNLAWRAIKNLPYYCECGFAFGRLEDRRGQWKFDDVCSAVNQGAKTITLTTTGGTLNQYANYLVFVSGGDHEDDEYTVASNTAATPTVLTVSETPGASLAADTLKLFDKLRPKLTTSPVMPGESAPNAYLGTPQVYWDVGDQNVLFDRCWSVEAVHSQEHSEILDSDSKYQTIYLGDFAPIQIRGRAILEAHKQLYDYIDREARQVNVKIMKPNSSYYILHKLYNCNIINWKETGFAAKGHYDVVFNMKAESYIGEFTLESESNWSTHYKHVT